MKLIVMQLPQSTVTPSLVGPNILIMFLDPELILIHNRPEKLTRQR
jgi:hypothetical protein